MSKRVDYAILKAFSHLCFEQNLYTGATDYAYRFLFGQSNSRYRNTGERYIIQLIGRSEITVLDIAVEEFDALDVNALEQVLLRYLGVTLVGADETYGNACPSALWYSVDVLDI